MSGAAQAAPVNRTRVRVPGVAIAAFLLLVLAVLSLAPAVSTSMQQQRQIADAEARIAQQRADLAGLTAQRARWDDPAYVRAQAGSRLFYVVPGTTAYRVIHASAPAPAPATTAEASRPDWTSVLARSLITAGTTTATPSGLATSP